MALAIALGADLLQIAFVPLAWTFVQAAIDVVAMLLVLPVLGFHLLLLPTFVIEFIPGVDMLPTWTGCVIAVIALKKRAESPPPAAPAETAAPPVIDVAEVRKASSNPSADEPCAPPPTQP
jgi:hypothetical protein